METAAFKQFQAIAETLTRENPAISIGKMLSAPGIRYQEKVFAFFARDRLMVRLGRGFDPAAMGVHEYQLLAPFKTKPPLLDWFEISADCIEQWEALARVALQRIIEHKGSEV